MRMNSFTQKIIYIGMVVVLLIPLAYIARPATRTPDNRIASGGILAKLRDQHNLSQAKLAEIDPASESMKLASLGLRGLAVNLLWGQAIEHKRLENWDKLESTLNALVKLQPNFIKVWEYQAHNLSYNISVEFDDYEQRYHWVKKGIRFLTKGLAANHRDHRMTDNLAWFTGMKIGYSDEKASFRRLFREDKTFREHMQQWVEPDSYNLGGQYRHDNWKLAYQWYGRSRDLISTEKMHTTEILFYRKQPSQLYQLAGAIQEEFRPDEIGRETWNNAHAEWIEYGKKPLATASDQLITLNELEVKYEEIEEKRKQLDALAEPGLREKFTAELEAQVELTPEQQAVLEIDADLRSEEEETLARYSMQQISREMNELDNMIATTIPDQTKVRGIVLDIRKLNREIRLIDTYKGTTNYRYWKIRTMVEGTPDVISARQKMYDAQELERQNIFDDDYVIDPVTGQRNIRKGAISMFEECYHEFSELFKQYPILEEGRLADDLLKSMISYQNMLNTTGMEWPDDFPLQKIVDEDITYFELPNSDELEERRLQRLEENLPDE